MSEQIVSYLEKSLSTDDNNTWCKQLSNVCCSPVTEPSHVWEKSHSRPTLSLCHCVYVFIIKAVSGGGQVKTRSRTMARRDQVKIECYGFLNKPVVILVGLVQTQAKIPTIKTVWEEPKTEEK